EHTLEQMINNLPDDISYSSVQVGDKYIPRRDLFDVRLQLIASEREETKTDKENQAAIEFASRPSDLVPRVYEGGMKTWECSLDLADFVLRGQSGAGELRGKKILELGCGTAIPTLAILQSLFDQPVPTGSVPDTEVHLQDYNASVLEYVTLPNIILVWFFSKAAEAYRATLPPPSPKISNKPLPDVANLTLESVTEEDEDEVESSEVPPTQDPETVTSSQAYTLDPSEPGELTFSPALQSAFLASLDEHRIKIRLFSGPWDKYDVPKVLGSTESQSYDLVLTFETIYQPSSLPSLVRLLREATGSTGTCLVAAKLVYFGVGGGIKEFEKAMGEGEAKGKMESVWEQREGVGRSILKVEFEG
ncbi:hypothetical protein BDV93DRAFT_565456, partial [Ceratobasidium sp. AG-I]